MGVGMAEDVTWLCLWLSISNLFICVQYQFVYTGASPVCCCSYVVWKLQHERKLLE